MLFFTTNQDINNHYVEGISLTHGGPGRRQHIWTFAAGITEATVGSPNNIIRTGCPCDTYVYTYITPFVGNDYFCESGFHFRWNYTFTLFPADPLWDGQDCIAHSSCCQFNNPPWFTKNLPNPTIDNIELRLCTHHPPVHEDIPIELIELYVQ